MKFGHNLPRNVVPEWSTSYIRYKNLKNLIKSAIDAKKMGQEPDLAEFFNSLDQNLEDVNHFYNKKFADLSHRLKLLEDCFGNSMLTIQRFEAKDVEDLLAVLLELRGQLHELQWYGEVNCRGFIKITKKLDKKLPGAQAQIRYLPTKVDPSPFATNSRLLDAVKWINDWLSILDDKEAPDDASSFQAASPFPVELWTAIKQASNTVSSATTHTTSLPDPGFQESVWDDWSGRGSHVDYRKDETVPLKQGRYLGWGINGGVYETTCKGVTLAWKRKICRSGIGPRERKEIDILKKLSHKHIIKLVGTYTHQNFLGILLWPVAICDLTTFFNDLELLHHPDGRAKWDDRKHITLERMRALGLEDVNSQENLPRAINRLRQVFGCLASAIEYLHSEQIRHKDLKPSNVLLARDALWVTDFGTSTDFSILSASGTDNGERGTPKYFAPEVAEYEKNGRSADIFSLGCVYLEMLYICLGGCLQALQSLRPARDRSFQANLDFREKWLTVLNPLLSESIPDARLVLLIRQMLQLQPSKRPTASEVVSHINLASKLNAGGARTSKYHGFCCDPTRKGEPFQHEIEEIRQQEPLQQEGLEQEQLEQERLQQLEQRWLEQNQREQDQERREREQPVQQQRKHIKSSVPGQREKVSRCIARFKPSVHLLAGIISSSSLAQLVRKFWQGPVGGLVRQIFNFLANVANQSLYRPLPKLPR